MKKITYKGLIMIRNCSGYCIEGIDPDWFTFSCHSVSFEKPITVEFDNRSTNASTGSFNTETKSCRSQSEA